jgi:hypothetical protein
LVEVQIARFSFSRFRLNRGKEILKTLISEDSLSSWSEWPVRRPVTRRKSALSAFHAQNKSMSSFFSSGGHFKAGCPALFCPIATSWPDGRQFTVRLAGRPALHHPNGRVFGIVTIFLHAFCPGRPVKNTPNLVQMTHATFSLKSGLRIKKILKDSGP